MQMSALSIPRLPGALVGALLAAHLLCGAVLAADPSPTPGASPTAPASDPTVFDAAALAGIIWLLVGAAVVSLLALLVYNGAMAWRFYDTAGLAIRRGKSVKVEFVAAVPGVAQGTPPQVPVKIEGPSSLGVGTAGVFKATINGQAAAADEPWAIDPANGGALNPRTGPSIEFVPAQTGVVKLSLRAYAAEALEVAVIESVAETSLPFVGRGYGTVAIAFLLTFVVLGLALAGRLGTDAVAAYVGGLLGYIFGRTTASTDGDGGTEK